jgi:hypothetical protein
MAVQPPPASSLVGKKVIERLAPTPADPGSAAFDLRRAAWRDETAGDRLDHDRPSSREIDRGPLHGISGMQRPSEIGAFRFVVLSSLRAAQLIRGCLPRVEGGHKKTITAQLEVSLGKVKEKFALDGIADVTTLAAEAAQPPAVAIEVT